MNTINDAIYGSFQIDEPVLNELLANPFVQRLKYIHQGGATYLVKPGRDGNRYEHSVGVMLLIRMLGGSLQEQIAGLLHDLSHTAFSHVVDQVFNDKNETFHEQHKVWLTTFSGIPEILKKHGYLTEDILDESNWSLLEQGQPDLCADRIDYTLRDLFAAQRITKSEIDLFINSLKNIDGKIIVLDINMAVWFTKQYFYEVTELFMNPLELFANNYLASVIRGAISEQIINIEDMLLLNDQEILTKINEQGSDRLTAKLDVLNFDLTVLTDIESGDADFTCYSKSRIVDPIVIVDGNLIRASSLTKDIFKMHELVREKSKEGIRVKLAEAQKA